MARYCRSAWSRFPCWCSNHADLNSSRESSTIGTIAGKNAEARGRQTVPLALGHGRVGGFEITRETWRVEPKQTRPTARKLATQNRQGFAIPRRSTVGGIVVC